ncbi:uncharacterized protein LOC111398228 [Olea europaea var. sylvestris]|uniref:uncharacterized protein LOC111398228 n=1 Tax=Olea europaea var. sylvestris TaxID=158386 RepID=UPI000C1D1F40|nr:uncharacterized protein LOC111398228 [Olea europaea var. sylvestris]
MSSIDSEAVDKNTGYMVEDDRMIPGNGLFRYPSDDTGEINAECWAVAEVAAQQVFPYGSMPLKTYLPHGDIDLTVIRSRDDKKPSPYYVLSLLMMAEQSENAEYEVQNSQLKNARDKIVKCSVEGIAVDISFNQFGGFRALCFLEQVDCLVGKNHLFKRSIILVKAWCYYGSHILGSQHRLLSTYALETLVLCIFHSSLNRPLEVLYGFLKYFSQFDWNTCCISLQGPVRISSLPDIVGEQCLWGLF